jgi:hypothetical protein
MVMGALPPINVINSLKTRAKLLEVSSRISTPAKRTDWKWLLTPMNMPKGILYRLVQ